MKFIDTNLYVTNSGQIIEQEELNDFETKIISERCYYIIELDMTIYKLKQVFYSTSTDFCVANTYGGYIVSLFNNIKNSFIAPGVIIFSNNYIENSAILKSKTVVKNSTIINSKLSGELNIIDTEITNSNLFGNHDLIKNKFEEKNIYFKDGENLPIKYLLKYNSNKNLWQFIFNNGEMGGFSDLTSYLSQTGTSKVLTDSKIINNSEIYDQAIIEKNSIINNSRIYDEVCISDKSYIKDSLLFNEVNVMNSKILSSRFIAGYMKDGNYLKGIKV